ncbi:MAG: Rrf2 family transcriptional regulator [Cyanobium sp. M30B3]|jgi:Rrf2 family transcriptional regulator, cysteine metabolism repressor|nr:MAG: Rrf2 family transcriptional regulator [Cyanobium sp. M30B3]
MAFNSRTAYGLVALLDLASAYTTGERVQTKAICHRHGLPERYLEQMLTALRKGGFLASVRGPRGGYQLTRSPRQITVAEVEACLECEPSPQGQMEQRDPEFQVLADLARRADLARQAVLRATTLEQLLVERDNLLQPDVMFYI